MTDSAEKEARRIADCRKISDEHGERIYKDVLDALKRRDERIAELEAERNALVKAENQWNDNYKHLEAELAEAHTRAMEYKTEWESAVYRELGLKDELAEVKLMVETLKDGGCVHDTGDGHLMMRRNELTEAKQRIKELGESRHALDCVHLEKKAELEAQLAAQEAVIELVRKRIGKWNSIYHLGIKCQDSIPDCEYCEALTSLDAKKPSGDK